MTINFSKTTITIKKRKNMEAKTVGNNYLANNNLNDLRKNPYPGRGIIVGMDETGEYLVQVYWIMGRSENSRNRIFVVEEGGVLKTAPFDPAKVKDPSLIIYTAMAEDDAEDDYRYAVSNGHQTMDALKGLRYLTGGWQYEPDIPNFTPRISGLIAFDAPFGIQTAEFSLLKKSPFSHCCESYLYKLDISAPGLGYCITTYDGDGEPLPSFTGDPYLLPLVGDINAIAQTIWDALNGENRVSLAVKFIDIRNHKSQIVVINKYK